MKPKATILEQLNNTNISDDLSLEMVGKLIRAEFDRTDNEDKAFQLLQLAHKWNVPQLGEMLNDYSIEDFKWF